MSPQEERNSSSQGGAERETNGQRQRLRREQGRHFNEPRHQQRLKLLRGCRHGHGGLGSLGELFAALQAAPRWALVTTTTSLLNGRGVQK